MRYSCSKVSCSWCRHGVVLVIAAGEAALTRGGSAGLVRSSATSRCRSNFSVSAILRVNFHNVLDTFDDDEHRLSPLLFLHKCCLAR